MEKYSKSVEELMIVHYLSLKERGRRHYAAIETLKLGFGGKEYIRKLFKMSPNTINRGMNELKNQELQAEVGAGRERKVGGGRKKF